MLPITWRGEERWRQLCCGNEICKDCYWDLRGRELIAEDRVAELQGSGASKQAIKAAWREKLQTTACPFCRAPYGRSKESARRIQRFAEAGQGWAMFELSWCYETGNGVVQDDRLAFEWLQKSAAAAEPHSRANVELGSCYLFGKGTAPEYAEALRLLRPA